MFRPEKSITSCCKKDRNPLLLSLPTGLKVPTPGESGLAAGRLHSAGKFSPRQAAPPPDKGTAGSRGAALAAGGRELLLQPQPGHGAGHAAGTAMALPGIERVGKLRQERESSQADGGCPLPATAQPCSALRENNAHSVGISRFCFCFAFFPPLSALSHPEMQLNNFEFPFL